MEAWISLALVQLATQADTNFFNQNLVFVPYLIVILIPSLGHPGIIDFLNYENNDFTSKKASNFTNSGLHAHINSLFFDTISLILKILAM